MTIVRWLLHGKKEATTLLPAAGVSEDDIRHSERFGFLLLKAYHDGTLPRLQDKLSEAGAVTYKPSIVFIEKTGHRMFRYWAQFIRNKGKMGDKLRQKRTKLFYYYLLIVLFILSPFAQMFFYLTYPIQHVSRKRLYDSRLK